MEEELGLSLGDMLKALKRRLIWIIIIPVIAAFAANWYVANMTYDVYTAQVKLYTLFDYVDSTGTTRYDLSSSAYFVNDFKELINTSEVITETCSRLGWPGWPNGVSVSVGAVTDTRFINIGVTSYNPELSMVAANTIAQVFTEYTRNLLQADSVSIASAATMPTYPSNSGRGRYVPLAFFAAMIAVMGIIIALEILNTKVRAESNADVKFQVNVLSNIAGYKKEMESFLKKHKNKEQNLLSCVSEHTQESVRKLALNVEFAAMGQPLHTLTVTSCTPKEGKSSVALMLACEYANQGNSVLLVDMDYRSPMLGRYLGRRNKKDIMDYLSGSASLQEVVSQTNTPNLFFMDSTHRIAVNANLESFDRFIKETQNHFDLVIFDTAPLGMFIDAASLAAKSDGTVVIVADNRVDRKELSRVLAQLKQVNAKVFGIAFNFVQHKQKNYYYNKYYRYGKQHEAERKATRSVRRAEADDEA